MVPILVVGKEICSRLLGITIGWYPIAKDAMEVGNYFGVDTHMDQPIQNGCMVLVGINMGSTNPVDKVSDRLIEVKEGS